MAISRASSAFLLFSTMLVLTSSARAQPEGEFINKLLDLSKQAKLIKLSKTDDELRRLLAERYNSAVEELKLRCDDFKKHTANKAMVFEAAKQLLTADLDMQATPAEKAKVMEKAVDLLKWYEQRMERAAKEELISRADLHRAKYHRLSLEIDLLKLRRSINGAAK